MKLRKVLQGVSPVKLTGNHEEEIKLVTYSSEKVGPGALFTALKGTRTDGNLFINEAMEKGAVAVLSENSCPQGFPATWIEVEDCRRTLALASANFFDHPSRNLKVIGVTGTKGKTTISYLLEEILKKASFRPAVIGTISYRGPGLNNSAGRTTPEAPELQQMMHFTLNQGATHCIIEVSSHALVLKRVEAVDFDISVFTNLSGEHLDYHHTLENYFEAKKKLFNPGSKKKMAVINHDDPWGKKLLNELAIPAITFGMEAKANIHPTGFSFSESGIEAEIKYPGGNLKFSSSLLGRPNLYNILTAVSVALIMGINPPSIQEGLKFLEKVPGRLEKIENSFGLNIFIDYAHTDDALKKLLQTSRELCQKKIILVFGAGGDRDKSKRPRMGEAAGELADWTIITSDNPRSEDPMIIISDIEKGLKKTGSSSYEIEPDRRAAIRKA
ncbi:MAG: UDP-N-acetylmuramoyl-L-alanyl-D-glutamate--2,6-diaminopimelate ligase, partial [Acidobacteriota bacterium]